VESAQHAKQLSTKTSHEHDSVVLVLAGSAESDAFGALTTALDSAHTDAVTHAARLVVADIRGLEFATSSCLKAFVTWLQRVRELDDSHRYKVRFCSSPRHAWQRRSLTALAAFATDVVEVETEAS
jgi:hypothetical protein